MEVKVRAILPEEVEFYRVNGWVKLPGLIDEASIRELRDALERQMDGKKNPRLPASTFRFWAAPSETCEPARNVAHAPDLARVARRLIGVPAVRQYFDAVLVKEPVSTGGTETRLHQDFLAQPFDMKGGLQFWLALHDVTADMGTVRFLNDSRRLGPLGMSTVWPEGVELPDVWPELKDFDVSPPLDLHMGDATVHDSLTVHWAGENHSDRSRWAMTVSYIRPETRYTGARNVKTDDLDLEIGQEFDHPLFPLFTD